MFLDLEKLSIASNIGFDIFRKIDDNIASSGEEYEILFSCSQKNLKKIEQIAKKHKTKLNFFAKAVKGSFRTNLSNHHFKN